MWLKKNTSCPLCNAAITSTRILDWRLRLEHTRYRW
jgi:hypothetical protein